MNWSMNQSTGVRIKLQNCDWAVNRATNRTEGLQIELGPLNWAVNLALERAVSWMYCTQAIVAKSK